MLHMLCRGVHGLLLRQPAPYAHDMYMPLPVPQPINCAELLYYDYTQLPPEKEKELGASFASELKGLCS